MSSKSRREGVPGTADHPASTVQQTSPAAPLSAPAPETTPGSAPESNLGKSAYLTEYQQDLDLLKLNQLLEAGDITQADYDEQKQNILEAPAVHGRTDSSAPPSTLVPETTPGSAPESTLGKSAYLTEYQQDLDLLKLNQSLEAGDITQADYDEQKQKVVSAHPGEPKADTPGASGLEARRQDPPGAG